MIRAMGSRALGHALALLLIAGCAAAPPVGAADRAPTTPTGMAGPGLDRFDAVVTGLIREFDIPGAGFALVYNGRLVLARGYGWADVEAGQPVEPTTRFLLASVSKSITAALFNASKGKPEGPELHQEYQHEIRAAIAAITTWPDVDLFDRYR
jgi:CubicO group peptidase (beta-lactamase class C family)